VHVVKPLVLSGFCRMVGWELAWRRIAFGRGGMRSQLAIEQSKGARRTIDCTNLDQFRQRWGALGSCLTKVLRYLDTHVQCWRRRACMLRMFRRTNSRFGKMSRGNSDIGDGGLAEIVALKTSRRVWTVSLSHSVALAG
jgi:hypothetical protein